MSSKKVRFNLPPEKSLPEDASLFAFSHQSTGQNNNEASKTATIVGHKRKCLHPVYPKLKT